MPRFRGYQNDAKDIDGGRTLTLEVLRSHGDRIILRRQDSFYNYYSTMAFLGILSFLHPRPLPRLSFIRSFLRTISTTPPLRQEGITVQFADLSSKQNILIYFSAAAIIAPTQPQEQLHEPALLLSYHVNRTPSKQLPIYHLAKRGGNLKQTRIRKISGDIAGLRHDLQHALGLKEEHIVINQLTKHIIIKVCGDTTELGSLAYIRMIQGWKRTEVAKFLQEKRF